MPELPEVETLRRQMERALVGRRIKSVEVRFGGRIKPSPKALVEAATGASFKAFGRRAKLLLSHLSSGWTIVTHLKMTGSYLLKPKDYEPGKHDHVIFRLSGVRGQVSDVLVFEDVRKFGFLKVVRTIDLEKEIFDKEGYGPEPLDPSFTFAKFKMCVGGRGRKKIKPLLLEQTCIAGVGNIYADEACWYGKVHPERTVDSLSEKELKGVYGGVVKSMTDALRLQGSSADDFVDLYGEEGDNVPNLRAYGREGEKCRRNDGGIMKKIWINSRAAHYCSVCQRPSRSARSSKR